jgi:hypothetical protein
MCSSGEYSDYGVEAIYSDEATALQCSKAYGWNDPVEMDLDPPVRPEVKAGRINYRVLMWVDDGKVYYTSHAGEPHEWHKDWVEDYRSYCFARRKGLLMTVYCWANDKDHAIKIANERRIAWKLNQDLQAPPPA